MIIDEMLICKGYTKFDIFMLVSYPMGMRGIFSRVKQTGCEADLSLLLVPRSKMCGTIPPPPNTSSWQGAYLSTGKIQVEFFQVVPPCDGA
jgi:hypothetical protein